MVSHYVVVALADQFEMKFFFMCTTNVDCNCWYS